MSQMRETYSYHYSVSFVNIPHTQQVSIAMQFQHIKNLHFPFDIDEKEEKSAWEGNQEADPNAQLLYAAKPAMYTSRILNSLRYRES